MSSTLGSYCDSVAMYWITSWPWPAWTSAAIRVGIWAWSMWSTVTLTPTLAPQSLANLSNQASWLHSRIFRSPDSFLLGSVKVSFGASVALPAGPDGPDSSSLAQAASGPAREAPSARAPVVRNRSRRLCGTDKNRDSDSSVMAAPVVRDASERTAM